MSGETDLQRTAFHRVALVAVVILSLLAGWQALSVRMDTSIDVWFLEDDPDLVSYDQFLEIFESDQIVVMAYSDEALWSDEGLLFLKEFASCGWLTSDGGALGRHYFEDDFPMPGLIEVEQPYEMGPPDPAELRERVLEDDLLAGLISQDGNTAAVLLTVEALKEESQLKIVLADSLRELAQDFEERARTEGRSAAGGGELRVELAGPTMMDAAFFTYTQRDFMLVFPLMLVVIVVVILVLFRTLRAPDPSLAVVLWTAGSLD